MNPQLETAWNDVASQLRGYVRSRVRDHAAAEDILQEIFLKAHRHAGQLDSTRNIPAWLFQIARNAITDHYRSSSAREKQTSSLRDSLELPHDSDESVLENPDALRESFRRMIFALPEPYREALLLTEYERLTQRELAARLGISFSGAKSRVQRAREKVKEALLDCCALEFDRRGNVIECEPRGERCKC